MKVLKVILVLLVINCMVLTFLYLKPVKQEEKKEKDSYTFTCISTKADERMPNTDKEAKQIITTDEAYEITSIEEIITLTVKDEKQYQDYKKTMQTVMQQSYKISFDDQKHILTTVGTIPLVDENKKPLSIWYYTYQQGLDKSFQCKLED